MTGACFARSDLNKHGSWTDRFRQERSATRDTVRPDLNRQQRSGTCIPFPLQQPSLFHAALSVGFRKARSRDVELLEEHPRIFDMWLSFLYTLQVDVVRKLAPHPDANRVTVEWYSLLDASVIGDRLEDSTFRDALLDAIVAKSTRCKLRPTGIGLMR
jgi:hypothetical protein